MIWWFFEDLFVENKKLTNFYPNLSKFLPNGSEILPKLITYSATIPKQNAILTQTAHNSHQKAHDFMHSFCGSKTSKSSVRRSVGRNSAKLGHRGGETLAEPIMHNSGNLVEIWRSQEAKWRGLAEPISRVSGHLAKPRCRNEWFWQSQSCRIIQVLRNSAKLGRKMADFRFWGGRFWRSQFLMKRVDFELDELKLWILCAMFVANLELCNACFEFIWCSRVWRFARDFWVQFFVIFKLSIQVRLPRIRGSTNSFHKKHLSGTSLPP